jgi:acetyl-CoA synthetase
VALYGLKAGYTATPELAADIFAHLRQRLGPYERIRRLEFTDIPKTISGKIRRTQLRQLEMKRAWRPVKKVSLNSSKDETASEEQYRPSSTCQWTP